MYKRKIICCVLICFIIFSLCACNKKNVETVLGSDDNDDDLIEENQKPEYGGQLVVPLTVIDTLNPLLSENINYYHFSKLIFESLFALDDKLDVKNVLADDYSIKDNGRVIDVSLKKDVYWHDGEKFTANDVKFTIDTIKYASNNSNIYGGLISSALNMSNSSDIRHVLDVKVLSDYDVRISFNRSYSNALDILTFPIIPKHLFVKNGQGTVAYKKALNVDNYKPIGTGPYKFEKYQKLKEIKLEVNENWWNKKPYIESIVGKISKQKDLISTAFETGQVDLATTIGVDWEKYDQNNDIGIYEFISPNYEFLGFNFSKQLFQGEKGRAIRQAIAYGIDRQSIVQKVYLGHASQVDVPINPDSWLISENSNVYGYNVDKAREVLEKAGWVDSNNDGIYEDEKGKNLTLKLSTNSYDYLRLETANIIADNLKKIGIQVQKDYNENVPEKLTEKMMEEQWGKFKQKVNKGKFDVVLLGWELSYVPDLSFAFHSSQINKGTNFIKYKNDEMDKLLVEVFNSPNRNQKKERYQKLQQLITKDLPYVSLFFRNKALLVNKKVYGNINPQSSNIYNNIEEWFIPKKYQDK